MSEPYEMEVIDKSGGLDPADWAVVVAALAICLTFVFLVTITL